MGLGPTGVRAVGIAAIAGVLTLWACGEDQANDAGSGNTTSGAAAGGAGGSGGATTTQGGGPVVDPKPNSQSCDQDAECQSGHCSPDDGVCCDSACDETCVACLQEKTGLPNGTCAPVLGGTNPDDECSAFCLGGPALCCGDSAAPSTGPDCPPECTGGCDGARCSIDCNGDEICRMAELTCPAGYDCIVACNGFRACDRTELFCPPEQACAVDCGLGNDVCRDMEIYCAGGPCALNCSEEDSCDKTYLNCGPNACTASCAPGVKTPEVMCGNACACAACIDD